MADDIVTQLRDVTEMNWDGDEVTEPLCAEAADEIERLREQVQCRDDVIAMLRADVARLGSFLHLIGEEARRG